MARCSIGGGNELAVDDIGEVAFEVDLGAVGMAVCTGG